MARSQSGKGVHIAAVLLLGGVALFTLRAAGEHNHPPEGGPADRVRVADSARLEVAAHWGPVTEKISESHKDWDELRSIRPATDVVAYSGADFQALLPGKPLAVGDTWELDQEGLLKFLRQLHPGATLKLHIDNGDSLGAHAILRACDERFADVLIRAHAEFVLKEGYFTPGQMAGRLVIDRSSETVAYFRLYLPDGPVNFDINRRVTGSALVNGKVVEGEFMSSGSGSLSRLELVGGDPQVVAALDRIPGPTVDQATATLARRFYRSKDIDWIDFDKALAVARRAGKPLHVVALAGTLDDESC
jgi:hypothetical protein